MKILYAEDDPSIRDATKSYLERCGGHKVTAMPDGMSALKEFSLNPNDFDVLLSDNNMPGLTGLELARHVRSVNPKTRVIIMSGLEVEGEYNFVDLILLKPVNMNELLKKITG